MKYPLKELVKAYFDLLSGISTVYDGQAPDESASEYIIIGERQMIPQPDMSNFYNECIVVLDIVNKTRSTGFKQNSAKVDAILALINQDAVLTLPSFIMENQVIESVQGFNSLNEKEKVFRTIVRVRSYLTEK